MANRFVLNETSYHGKGAIFTSANSGFLSIIPTALAVSIDDPPPIAII